MSAWTNSADWRPPQIGIFNPTEPVAGIAWVAPCALGALLLVADKIVTGTIPAWPQAPDQIGLFHGYLAATLIWSPLWGLPAVIGALLLRLILLSNGWFGWASALIAGALGGIAVPPVMGLNYWLIGPLYGAAFLWLQQVIYSARYPTTFNA
jgi:hypothetical protein